MNSLLSGLSQQVDGEAYVLVNPKSLTISKATPALLLRSMVRRP